MKRKIDFYKKKEKIHKEMCEAIKDLMNEDLIDEINFKDLGVDGGFVCLADSEPAIEVEVAKLRCRNTQFLEFVPEDDNYMSFDGKWFSLDNDVLTASFDTLYDAVFSLLRDKSYAKEKKKLMEKQTFLHCDNK